MASEASELSPENESFLEDVIEYFQNTVSRDMLHYLLNDHEAWETFIAEATLSREEAEALREGLNELQRAIDIEAEEQQARERFLSEFPELKAKLKERIRKLYELADEVDRVHRDCTITNVVAGSTGAASGVLSILGLVLAPFTAGASLTLTAVGAGLGAASAVTQVSAGLVESSSESSAIEEANRLISSDTEEEEVVPKIPFPTIAPDPCTVASLCKNLKDLASDVRAIKAARANLQLVVQAQRLTKGAVAVRTARQVGNTFARTTQAVTKGARILGAATAGLFLAMDVYNLVNDSGHLQEGAKSESAEEMRQQARELERKLEELTKVYESLTEGPTLHDPEQGGEQGCVWDQDMEVPY